MPPLWCVYGGIVNDDSHKSVDTPSGISPFRSPVLGQFICPIADAVKRKGQQQHGSDNARSSVGDSKA